MDNHEFFRKYFDDWVDYPSFDGEILPMGVCWQFVSHTFLNAFAIGIIPLRLVAHCSYSNWDRKREGVEESKNITRGECLNKIIKNGIYHLDLSGLDDNATMLAKSRNDDIYWYFDWDSDVSDCNICRFTLKNNVAQEELESDFIDATRRMCCGNHNGATDEAREIPVNKIKGLIHYG